MDQHLGAQQLDQLDRPGGAGGIEHHVFRADADGDRVIVGLCEAAAPQRDLDTGHHQGRAVAPDGARQQVHRR
jgi:hypothetical protein